MNRAPANKENVVPIPARYPCQKDIGVRPGKRKAETNLGVSSSFVCSASPAVFQQKHQIMGIPADTMDEGERSLEAPEPW